MISHDILPVSVARAGDAGDSWLLDVERNVRRAANGIDMIVRLFSV
jgi:hypothetical protein